MSYGNYPEWENIKNILVIKTRHLGDVLLTSPIFQLLKNKAPSATIDALIYKETLPILEGHPAISTYFLYDREIKQKSWWKRCSYECSLFLKIINKKYDLVINLTEGDRGAVIALLCGLYGTRYRVGIDPKGRGFYGKKHAYTHMVKVPKTPRHAVEKNIDVLRRIGIFPTLEERGLYLHIPQESYTSLHAKFPIEPHTYIVIHPVSRWLFKAQDPSYMADLVRELAAHYTVVITSGKDPQERAYIREMLKDTPPNVHDMSGALSLKELAALIDKSACLLSVDTVALHIASAVKAPVVALFGPSSEMGWGPWMHPRARVLTAPMTCRPCFLDGCGGSKKSDCLNRIPRGRILDAIEDVARIRQGAVL